jgi:hypothetical protein
LPDFKKKGDSDFATFIAGVVTGLSNNPKFPSPPVAIADFSKAVDTYLTALTAAEAGGKILISAKNDVRKVVEGMLVLIVQYVNYNSGGGKTAILSTGFLLAQMQKAAS